MSVYRVKPSLYWLISDLKKHTDIQHVSVEIDIIKMESKARIVFPASDRASMERFLKEFGITEVTWNERELGPQHEEVLIPVTNRMAL